MSTYQDLLDDFRDRLDDEDDVEVILATKMRFLDRGVTATWPRFYKRRSVVVPLVYGVTAYPITVLYVGERLIQVMLEDEVGGESLPFRGYEMAGSTLHVRDGSELIMAGHDLTLTFMHPLERASGVVATVCAGPYGSEAVPVHYAMSLACARAIHSRTNYERMSTTDVNNVGLNDIMAESQFWLDRFAIEMDQYEMSQPELVAS